nr:P15 protein [Bee Macula-like virus]
MATPSFFAGLKPTTMLSVLILSLCLVPSFSQLQNMPSLRSPRSFPLLSTPLIQWSRIPLPIPILQGCTSPPSDWKTPVPPCSFSEESLKSLLQLLLPILREHGYIPHSCRSCFNYWHLPPIPNLYTPAFPNATGNV